MAPSTHGMHVVKCIFPTDIEQDFKARLVELMPIILSPLNLVPKEINGQDITASDLLEYFKVRSACAVYYDETVKIDFPVSLA